MLKSIVISVLLIAFFSCSGGKVELPKGPSDLILTINLIGQDSENPNGDGSGTIELFAAAKEATNYTFSFGDGNTNEVASGYASHNYTHIGTQDFDIKVTASNAHGAISITERISVSHDPYLLIKSALTNSSSKTWYWNHTVFGHLGQGPSTGTQASNYTAAPNELAKVLCLYNDKITFTKEPDGQIICVLDNGGDSYFNAFEVFDALGVENPSQDDCYEYATATSNRVSFAEAESGILNSTRKSFSLADNGFMSYYLGASTYEILSISDTEMYLRVLQDVDGGQLAWYQKFTSIQPPEPEVFDQLVWSDEFSTDGSPDAQKWNFDIGTGDWGWGNNELQYYTNRSENVIQEDGKLIITAKKEQYANASYTSTRLKTQGKFSFTYGRVEVRAMLPSGRGVWPAIWMLGDDITTVGWPACGEVDILEYVGYQPDVVHSAIHTTSSSGNTENKHSHDLATAEEEFHVYAIEWTTEEIRFYVDDTLHYTYTPNAFINDYWPFNKDQFLILNLAIGGNWGGSQGIDDAIFPQQYVVDYVRVYQ